MPAGIEIVSSGLAVCQARYHEQAYGILRGPGADRVHHFLVVVDRDSGGNGSIGPAFVQEKLSAALYKFADIRIGSIDYQVFRPFNDGKIGIVLIGRVLGSQFGSLYTKCLKKSAASPKGCGPLNCAQVSSLPGCGG